MTAPSLPGFLPGLMRVLGQVLLTGFGLAIAWVLWELGQYDLWFLQVFAAICLIGVAIRLGKGVGEAVKLLWQRLQWRKYANKGIAPKADQTASIDTLKQRGLIK